MTKSVTIRKDGELTVYEAKGLLSYDELSNVVDDYYNDKLTSKVIFDMTNGTGVTICSDEVKKLAKKIDSLRKHRPKGKTAIIVSQRVDFGLANMACGNIFDKTSIALPFYSKEDALKWLEE